MVDLKESFHESVIIRRAKRRLIGAIVILIILFTLSMFFVKNIKSIDENKEIKVSFLEMGPVSFKEKESLEDSEVIKLSNTDFSKKTNTVNSSKNNTKIFTIQIGIFSDKNKIKKLSGEIRKIGFKTQIKKVKLSGQEKIKLTTQSFSTEKEAKSALIKLKNANFPGLIKRQ